MEYREFEIKESIRKNIGLVYAILFDGNSLGFENTLPQAKESIDYLYDNGYVADTIGRE